MDVRVRVRPAITPLSLSPGLPVSSERIRGSAWQRRGGAEASHFLNSSSEAFRWRHCRTGSMRARPIHTHRHTPSHIHARLSSLALCLSLFCSHKHPDKILRCPLPPHAPPFSNRQSIGCRLILLLFFPFSVSPAAPLRLCWVAALYCSSLPSPSPPFHRSPSMPERRGEEGEAVSNS